MKFSDECSFELGKNGQVRVWRRKGERNHTQNLTHVKRSGRISIMVWGIISFEGVGPLQIVEGRFNSANYVDILENHVVSFVGYGIFMHDNAPIHITRVCKDFFSKSRNNNS